MEDELIYRMAISMVPQIGAVHARILVQAFNSARDIFSAPKRLLEKLDGIGSVRARNIKAFANFEACEKEIRFTTQHKIRTYYLGDPDYPKRLFNCYDAPVIFFYKGSGELNCSKILSVVGTRNPSLYGKGQCENLIAALPKDVLIVSGLASGIDTIAHRAAHHHGLNTLGILAHGLDTIYPRHNTTLAGQMTTAGGLLTEFMSGTQPDRQNFPERNRIVAGISDGTVVVETGPKGGSMITARLANEYNREVFAYPGRSVDLKSEGCNTLIKTNRAQMITSPADLLEFMNWADLPPKKNVAQAHLFPELTETEKLIAGILMQAEKDIDELLLCGLPAGKLAATLLSLELNGLVETLPGKRYRWNG